MAKANEEKWLEAYRPLEVGETIATASRIGNPTSAPKVIREIVASKGAMALATEAALREAVLVCASDGHFICPQTGAAFAGLREAVKNGTVAPRQKVVVVSTADGLKFTQPFIDCNQESVVIAPDCKVSTVAQIMGLEH